LLTLTRFIPLAFFVNTPPPPVIYTLSLHDALPISRADSVSTAKAPYTRASKPALVRSDEISPRLGYRVLYGLGLKSGRSRFGMQTSSLPPGLRTRRHSASAACWSAT